MNIRMLPLLLLVAIGSTRAQSPDGLWSGAITVMGMDLKILVTFSRQDDSLKGTIDIPQQMAKGLGLRNIRWVPPKVHFELPAGPSLALFDGVISADSIAGAFLQSGATGTFRLDRAAKDATPAVVAESPVPYRQEEVVFRNDTVTLAGTVTLPETKGPYPAVVMITGSGPQNRDEELLGFKPFRMIADHFTRRGIAVLRYDDRGVGGSTGNTALSTTEDFAGDVLAAIEFLKKRPDIAQGHIGLCGHSEGGIIAPIVASRSKDVAFIILIAGTAVNGERIVLYQVEAIARAGGASETELSEALALQKKTLDVVRSGKGWESLEQSLKEALAKDIARMKPEERTSIDSADVVNSRAGIQLAGIRTPWFKYFVTHEPALTLEKVTCPVLAIFGGLDMQVPITLNQPPLEDALRKGGNTDWRVEVFPAANHLFLNAKTGSPSEYATLTKEFVPGFLETMSSWIIQRVITSSK